jgi:hypothetical protein
VPRGVDGGMSNTDGQSCQLPTCSNGPDKVLDSLGEARTWKDVLRVNVVINSARDSL